MPYILFTLILCVIQKQGSHQLHRRLWLNLAIFPTDLCPSILILLLLCWILLLLQFLMKALPRQDHYYLENSAFFLGFHHHSMSLINMDFLRNDSCFSRIRPKRCNFAKWWNIKCEGKTTVTLLQKIHFTRKHTESAFWGGQLQNTQPPTPSLNLLLPWSAVP